MLRSDKDVFTLSTKMKILSCGAGQQSTALTLMSCDNVLNPNKFPQIPMCDMGLVRADNYAYVRETWGLETKGSACLFCPFHTNYFFLECKHNCKSDYKTILEFDEMLEQGEPNSRIGVPNSKIYISMSRKRIKDLQDEECRDKETFYYKGKEIWNGF